MLHRRAIVMPCDSDIIPPKRIQCVEFDFLPQICSLIFSPFHLYHLNALCIVLGYFYSNYGSLFVSFFFPLLSKDTDFHKP